MDRIIWKEHPKLRSPKALIAFDGWGDAGAASTLAVRHIVEVRRGEMFASIDGEDYLDYQVRRPLIELDEAGVRSVRWPVVEFYAMAVPQAERDLIVVTGPEPNVRWRTFTNDMLTVLEQAGVGDVVTLGAFAGQVPHTLPVPLVGSGADPELIERHGLLPSGYEGPTGIVGVVNQAFVEARLNVVSLWAAVPHYLSTQDYPPAALALLEKAIEILDMPFDLASVVEDSDEFRRQVDEALDDPELKSYIEELEADSIDQQDPGGQLVEEIERFLRGG